MSYYHQGLAAPQKQVLTGYQVGALIATPGYIRDQVNALDAEVQAMSAEVNAQLPQGIPLGDSHLAWYRSAWVPFATAWAAFRDGHQGWSDNMWGGVVDNNNNFRTQLIALRHSAESVGFQFQTPEPAPPQEGWLAGLQGIGTFIKNVVYVVLALVGGVLLIKFAGITYGRPATGMLHA